MRLMARIKAVVCVYLAVTLILMSVGSRRATADETDGKYIVIYVDGTDLDAQKLLLTLLGVEVVHVLSLINALAIKIPLGLIGSVLQILLNDPNVAGVFDDPVGSADYTVSIEPTAPPPEEFYPWGLDRIHIPEVHAQMAEATGSGVTVAVLDTGIDRYHPELNPQGNPRIVDCFNALPGGGSCDDDNGHGTHVAGIIAAGSNLQGVIGAAPLIKLAAIKVLSSDGAGHISDCINGLQRVYTKRYPLVNMSLGFPEDNVPLQRAIARLYQRGTIMVASVGNTNPRPSGAGEGSDGEGSDTTCDPEAAGEGSDGEGSDTENYCYRTTNIKYPAAYPTVIGVGATDIEDRVTNYSRIGEAVDLVAPGGSKESGRILSTNRGGGYGEGSGTSQAAAHVTGAVALVMQRQALQGRPALTFSQMLALLQNTAVDLGEPSEFQGAGLLDVGSLMNALQ
ncbi:MAG TPA: S8 family serine peptidase [Alphaproteobacteria bacterium]|nr:S8 family serine peptidase [Alphaproteobacteria bacterium]